MLHSSNNRHDVDEACPRHAVPNDSATDHGLLVAALAPSWFTPAMDRPAAATYGCYDPPPTTPATYQSTACLAPSTAMYHATTAGVGDLHYYQNDVIATPPYFVADRRLPPEVLDGGVYGGMSMHYRDAVPAGDAWMTTTSSLTPPPSMFAWRNTQVGCSSDLEPVRNFQPYYGSVVVDQPSCRSPVGADTAVDVSEGVHHATTGANMVRSLPRETRRRVADRGSVATFARRPRTSFSTEQLHRLRQCFAECQYIDVQQRAKISAALGLTEKQVKVWFQNQRSKIKRAQSSGDDVTSHHSLTHNHHGSSSSPRPFP